MADADLWRTNARRLVVVGHNSLAMRQTASRSFWTLPPTPSKIAVQREGDMTPQEIAFLAAGCSAIAAICSAAAAWRVPHAVAEQNEKIRKGNEARTRKLHILETLVQHRAMIAEPASVAALNSIVIVFSESSRVKDAFTRFLAATSFNPMDKGAVVERYIAIINAIVSDLGMDGQIAGTDVDQIYFPEALGMAKAVESAEIAARFNAMATANNDPRTR